MLLFCSNPVQKSQFSEIQLVCDGRTDRRTEEKITCLSINLYQRNYLAIGTAYITLSISIFPHCLFRCAVASLYEVVSVRPSLRPSVRRSVCPVLFSKVKSTHTRRILCRVSGLVFFMTVSMHTFHLRK